MFAIDDLQEVVRGLLKEPIIGPLKSKMAEICHLGSWRQNAKREFLNGTSAQEGYLVPFKVYMMDKIWKYLIRR